MKRSRTAGSTFAALDCRAARSAARNDGGLASLKWVGTDLRRRRQKIELCKAIGVSTAKSLPQANDTTGRAVTHGHPIRVCKCLFVRRPHSPSCRFSKTAHSSLVSVAECVL